MINRRLKINLIILKTYLRNKNEHCKNRSAYFRPVRSLIE